MRRPQLRGIECESGQLHDIDLRCGVRRRDAANDCFHGFIFGRPGLLLLAITHSVGVSRTALGSRAQNDARFP